MGQAREHWGSRLGFILAAAGSAIGLGSLWRFPYIAGENGGGAFVILYIIFTFVIGLPVFIAELVIGRRTQKGAVSAYSELSHHKSNWKMLGYLNILTCFIILSFYCVVSGWCLNYSFMSLNQFTLGKSPEEIKNVFNLVYTSPDMNLFWLFIFLLLNVGILYSGIRKGIEHWSKILMPALFIILISLFVYSCTFDGFGKAFLFVFSPDFSKLTSSNILNALGMAFFTLSVGLGIILTYGSYLKESENIPKTALIVALLTLSVSLLAALLIFPIVFTYDLPPEGGPGLVFQTMPILFAKLKGSLIISTIFFLLLTFSALTSTISLFEVLISNLIELFHWTRGKALIISTSATFVLGIPCALSGSQTLFPTWTEIYGKDFFDTLNYITASWMMPIAGLLTTIFIGFIMEKHASHDEFLKGSMLRKILRPWYFSVKWVAPIAVFLIILEKAGILGTLFSYLK